MITRKRVSGSVISNRGSAQEQWALRAVTGTAAFSPGMSLLCPSSDSASTPTQVSQSKEHQQFITFLQRLLGPLLEAYSSAAVFVHTFSGPVPEQEYLHRLHRYLLTRTERSVAVYGEHALRGSLYSSAFF